MIKLIDHIFQNPAHQIEIFNSLSTFDINKIISNLEDSNITLRQTSAYFLCELLYDNNHVQELFSDITGLLAIDGKICLN